MPISSTDMALLSGKSDAGQNRAVIKESEAGIEAALDHPSDGILETLLMCCLVAIMLMLAKSALGLVCCCCNNRTLNKCDLAKCTAEL